MLGNYCNRLENSLLRNGHQSFILFCLMAGPWWMLVMPSIRNFCSPTSIRFVYMYCLPVQPIGITLQWYFGLLTYSSILVTNVTVYVCMHAYAEMKFLVVGLNMHWKILLGITRIRKELNILNLHNNLGILDITGHAMWKQWNLIL